MKTSGERRGSFISGQGGDCFAGALRLWNYRAPAAHAMYNLHFVRHCEARALGLREGAEAIPVQ